MQLGALEASHQHCSTAVTALEQDSHPALIEPEACNIMASRKRADCKTTRVSHLLRSDRPGVSQRDRHVRHLPVQGLLLARGPSSHVHVLSVACVLLQQLLLFARHGDIIAGRVATLPGPTQLTR